MADAQTHHASDPSQTSAEGPDARHVAIIMDGNGRWAQARGLPRTAGHKAGVDAVRRTVQAAGDMGLQYLTLYGFSQENWARPQTEVSALLALLKQFVEADLSRLAKAGVQVRIIGDRAGLSADLRKLVLRAEERTKDNSKLVLTIAFSYGSRDEIVRAVNRWRADTSRSGLDCDINADALGAHLDTAYMPDPDLIIRTSGEKRISNFLLWQSAYAELVFQDCFWPDYDRGQLEAALTEYKQRDRRFGKVRHG